MLHMLKKKPCTVCLIGLITLLIGFHSYSQRPDSGAALAEFNKLRNQAKYLNCMNDSKNDDAKLNDEFKRVFLKKVSWIEDKTIIKLIITKKDWGVSREDFTGRTKMRFLFADIIIATKNNEYFIAQATFFQKNKFLGLIYGDTDLKIESLSLFKIQKEHINTICKPYIIKKRKNKAANSL